MALWNRKKVNCWEFNRCGREPGGIKSFDLGICPAAMDGLLGAINHGKARGRVCWMVANDACLRRLSQFADEDEYRPTRHDCRQCEFYLQVMHEEGRRVQVPLER